MIPNEYSWMPNVALFAAQALSASRQTSIRLFGWECKPPALTGVLLLVVPGAVLGVNGRCSVSLH